MKKSPLSTAILSGLLCLSGCTGLADLSELGHPPRMTKTSDPTQAPDYRPITMPMPPLQPPPTEVGSLWRPGSRAFFKDQRASQVGDLITIDVNIADNAAVVNNTSAAGSGSQTFGIPSLFGAQGKTLSSSTALDTSSASANTAAGTITRNETVTLALAGTITQVLPNGNFVVMARQEVRVNGELRQLMVSGVVRPQDITEDNTVTHDRIAEARISYGGRGQLSKIQTPRYGQQVLDSVLPF
ncbi:flagellar basal body L-ring protein FlgH [Gluconacetobacter takamatsuzukensis]|uniref:Flagellar L-ring protein n=1 Tax=Gluconacetobacter takamatsuzukensis TaxID=1286190 RepID=A0A7W4KB11_9PROT|nr:flagellar basal body L-ring protein FlgH [Gluconacetobacter takamatsuzukensis]